MATQTSFFENLPSFRRAGGKEVRISRNAEYAISVLSFAAALALRFLVDPILPPGFPYLTFFPAVVIIGFVFGVRQGAVVAVLSGLAAWYYFISPHRALEFSSGTVVAMALYVFVVTTDLLLIHLMMKAYGAEIAARRQLQDLAEHQEMMAHELDHRLKNVFATMNAVISLSQRHSSTPEDLARKLQERLNAMSRSNLLLRGLNPGEETTLGAVLVQAMQAFGLAGTGRLFVDGTKIVVSAQAVVVLSLILHELGTNAAKHGALSVPDGRIIVSWDLADTELAVPMLTFRWREEGGPRPSSEPSPGGGFGSKLISRVIATLSGKVDVRYPPEGAEITFVLPLSSIVSAAGKA